MAVNDQGRAVDEERDTHHKALSINLGAKIYGSFAEIGAGQEVARWFLRVGAASGTVAKTISAYDKEVSDDLYGSGTRYVSRPRVEAMLDREWELLLRQLGDAREADSRLFVFADTMAARNFAGTNECHGWMGLRFQTVPGGAAHQIVLHVNLLDHTNFLQQEAVGVLGVNLIHGAFHRRATIDDFLAALFDDLATGRIEVDLAAFSGPELAAVDPRLVLVELARSGRATAVAFPADGTLVPPTELLHGRAVLLEPGHFTDARPVFGDMLTAGVAQLRAELEADAGPPAAGSPAAGNPDARPPAAGSSDARPPAALYVLSVQPEGEDAPTLPAAEILRRVDALQASGHGVLVFRRRELYRMSELINRFTAAPIRFVTGLSTLIEVFQDRHNEVLAGALLEALARLFARNVRVYAYPMRADVLAERLDASFAVAGEGQPVGDAVVTGDQLRPAFPYGHLYQYLLHSGFIVPLGADTPPR